MDRVAIVEAEGRRTAAALLAAEIEDPSFAIGDPVESACDMFETYARGDMAGEQDPPVAAIKALGRERGKALFVRGFLSEMALT